MIIIVFLLIVAVIFVVVPSTVLTVEVIAAIFSNHHSECHPDPVSACIAVLVPAHNESAGLIPTLDDVKEQLRPRDRLLVVADNCDDDTASVAASAGAEVTTRADPSKIGKGYALDWGLKYLATNPPDIVIIVDADCRTLKPAQYERLASVCENVQRPVQALYLMTAPMGSTINHQVAEFAWRLKNWVRPLGLSAIGLPCQLMGTGMAFPWDVIRLADLSNGFIAEDLKLGLELAHAGYSPQFLSSAVVRSTFPTTVQGTALQRNRWEQGHLALIMKTAPILLYRALKDRNSEFGLIRTRS